MSSVQRKRGVLATVWRTEAQTDNRGNVTQVPVLANPHQVRAVFIPQRSSRAEVPGQMEINVTRMIISHDLEGVDLWSRVEAMGKTWDVVTPPAYHHGTKHVRHWSIDLRERP